MGSSEIIMEAIRAEDRMDKYFVGEKYSKFNLNICTTVVIEDMLIGADTALTRCMAGLLGACCVYC